jgi:hypothetical protein
VSVEGCTTLVSWSGSMFEYLMPLLMLRSHPETLLESTCRAVVRAQILYGQRQRVPWGISESAYHVVDAHGTYQYKAFGVPGLGVEARARRGPGDRAIRHRPGRPGRSRRRSGQLPPARPRGRHGRVRIRGSARLHAAQDRAPTAKSRATRPASRASVPSSPTIRA